MDVKNPGTINQRELEKIRSIITNLEKQSPQEGSRYYLNGTEIYSSVCVHDESSSNKRNPLVADNDVTIYTTIKKTNPYEKRSAPKGVVCNEIVNTFSFNDNCLDENYSSQQSRRTNGMSNQAIINNALKKSSNKNNRLAEIDYYLGLADKIRTNSSRGGDECGYKLDSLQLRKVEWGNYLEIFLNFTINAHMLIHFWGA